MKTNNFDDETIIHNFHYFIWKRKEKHISHLLPNEKESGAPLIL